MSALANFWRRLFGLPSLQEEEHLPYMNKVDAALHRKGRVAAVFLSLGTAVLLCILVIWAAWASIDEVTRGHGQVVSASGTQVIQNLEGGILREVLVREGQIVEKDQPLARLDNLGAASQYTDALTKALENRVALARLEAEKNAVPPTFDAELLTSAPQVVADQEDMYHSRRERFLSEMAMLTSQHRQRLKDVDEHRGRKTQLEHNLALAEERRDLAKPLEARKLYPRVDFLDLEQRVVTLRGDLEAIAATLGKAEEAAREIERKLNLHKAEYESDINAEINKRRTELTSLQAMLSAGGDRVTRTELRSPVRGTVKRVIINTLGGVVRSGDPIMEIVPLGDTLLVEARIRPADIAFIHADQRAMVKISAYDFSIYGGLEAVVEQISADTIEDKKSEFYYLVKLRTKKNEIVYRNEHLPIIPGMVAGVEIVSGKKTVLDYLLKPLLKAQQNAMRER